MTPKLPIYMDYSATTPCDPRVVDKMLPYFHDMFGNAASRNHSFGWAGESAVTVAREEVAKLINAHPKEIIWTSGSTEANNLAIKGVAEMYKAKGNHIISCATEHKAVLDPIHHLESPKATKSTFLLAVDGKGCVDLDELRAAITDKTILVISLMAANNEVGTLHPIEQDRRDLPRRRGSLFHTDATQAAGKIPLDVVARTSTCCRCRRTSSTAPRVSVASTCGASKPRVRLVPILDGGGHERGMRSGTLNVTGIVGMGEGCDRLARKEWTTRGHEADRPCAIDSSRGSWRAFPTKRTSTATSTTACPAPVQHLVSLRRGRIPDHGDQGDRRVLGLGMHESASLEPSYVLKSLGLGDELAHSSIRFSARPLHHRRRSRLRHRA